MLDLRLNPFSGQIRLIRILRDDAVDPGAFEFGEPPARLVDVARRRGHVDRRASAVECLFQPRATDFERFFPEIGVAEGEEIERDERHRCVLTELFHAARRRVNPLLQREKVQSLAVFGEDDRLAVDHAALRELTARGLDEIREVPRHGLLAPAADLHVVPVTEHDRAVAVPFGLVEAALGDRGQRPREHRGDRRSEGQCHGGDSASAACLRPLRSCPGVTWVVSGVPGY